VASVYRARPDFDLTELVVELVESESMPFLPVLRYKESGLRKRAIWEQVWDLQRREALGLSATMGWTSPNYGLMRWSVAGLPTCGRRETFFQG
jgi:hypothetical protein